MWNQRHLMIVLREYEDFYNTHRPHRALNQAAPLRPLPDGVTDLDDFRVRRRDRAGGVFTNTAWWRRFSAPTTGFRHVQHLRSVLGEYAGHYRPASARPTPPSATIRSFRPGQRFADRQFSGGGARGLIDENYQEASCSDEAPG